MSKPTRKLIFVSQVGFDRGAGERKFHIETAEGVEVLLVIPRGMFKLHQGFVNYTVM